MVGYDQDVLCPTSIRFQKQVIHAYKFKWSTCLDVYKAGVFFSLGLAADTPLTGPDFPVNIHRHSWPIETCVDKVQCPVRAEPAERMAHPGSCVSCTGRHCLVRVGQTLEAYVELLDLLVDEDNGKTLYCDR